MIRIGLNLEEKKKEIEKYIFQNKIQKVYVFYYKTYTDYRLEIETEYIEYADIIMYKFFYRLLEEINNDSLVVVDECMRTQNRGELTYNCAHHYLNQTQHKIVFEYFPFIEQDEDFLILLDFQNKGKYKGKGFDWGMLNQEDISAKPIKFKFNVKKIDVTEKQKNMYQDKKEKLFSELGSKHPDTVPRNLHVFVGSYKKPFIQNNLNYIARNKRFNLGNVTTYKEIEDKEYILLDFPHRKLDINDFLKNIQQQNITFISTDLPVDQYYQRQFQEWIARLEGFYAKASIYK